MRYVIIGNSAAGVGAVEGMRKHDKSGEIAIISSERHHTYSRPLISYLLLGKVTEESIKYRPGDFYDKMGCTLINAEAVRIEPDEKRVVLSNGRHVPYDKLLCAAGSRAFVPGFEGLETVNNKYTFMSLDDALELRKALGADKRVLIIGAGLIGLKCAEGILERVLSVTVVDLAARILSSILDEGGAAMVQKHLEDKGIDFILGAGVKRFEGNTAVLEDGGTISFDILVLAVGVRPNTELLKGIAEIGRGIIINEKSETSAHGIYAAGDCTETFDASSRERKIMALLPNAYMQGECAGENMAVETPGTQGSIKIFDKAIPMNAIGFFGLHIITAGSYTGSIYEAEDMCNYKRLFYGDNRLKGFILIGDIQKAGIYTSLIRECTPLDTIDFGLICEKPGLMAFSRADRAKRLGEAR